MSHQKSSIISKKTNKGRGVRFAPPTYPNEKYRWVVFPDPWVRVRFTQSPLQKQKGEPPLTLFPYHKLLKVSIVSSVFIPPPDFPEPPLLLLFLLFLPAAEDRCV